ncbi:DUF1934 domain-containing protein [Gracilibacillus caseinilyticus]|uniref:DUF1934 domain-containing protein n=1 Tax=Gracilibacillus caseinilyticus TaxID=2932256 RepID=A0ABY4F1Y5_9BACI|nr:DUF1934 domain-containing protein [Gracilibacillus caseinilyticus]UOQ50225.1 DUF1934 domain-containing protein [Gracilibacillus caseinilyticus]
MNKSQVAIKMTMEIFDTGQKDVTVVEETGLFFENEGKTVLKFSELNENKEQTNSLITIHPDKVSVKRSGAVTMLQQFQRKQKTENVYRHQFGTIHMETETDQILYHPPEAQKSGKLFISYQTSLNGEPPRRHRLTITMKKEN